MKRKYLILFVVVCMLFSATGCSLSKVTLTEKESDAIAEYMAHLILKYDKRYTPSLMYREDYEAEVERRAEEARKEQEAIEPTATPEAEEPTPTPEGQEPGNVPEPGTEPGGETEPTPEPEPVYSLQDMFPMKNIAISYEGFDVLDEYVTGTEYFPLTAPEGGKILMLKFRFTSSAAKEKRLDTGKFKLTYLLELEDGERLEAKTSLLENDIQFINDKIDPGAAYDGVLVFFIDEKDVDTPMTLFIYSEDKSASVTVRQ